MDYSKLSDNTLQTIASGKPLDYAKLSDDELQEIAQSPAPKQEEQPSSLNDFETGLGRLGGLGEITAGATQGGLDKAQSWLHKLAPSLAGASPSQVNAALQKLGVKGDIGPTSSSQMYKQAEQEQMNKENAASGRSPMAYGAGNVAGDVLGWMGVESAIPKLIGAGGVEAATEAGIPKFLAKAGSSAVNLAPVGAVAGAMGSEGHLIGGTPEEHTQVGQSAIHGAETASLLGASTDLAMSGAKSLAETKPAQKLTDYFNLGKEGRDLSSEVSRTGSLNQPESLENSPANMDVNFSKGILKDINEIDSKLGSDVGQSLRDGADQSIIIKPTDMIKRQMDSAFKDLPSIEVDAETDIPESSKDEDSDGDIIDEKGQLPEQDKPMETLEDYANKFKSDGLDPVELHRFRNAVSKTIQKAQRSPDINAQIMTDYLRKLNTNLTDLLKQTVPDYAVAAERLKDFRTNIPETILGKENGADIDQMYISGTRKVDTKLLNGIKNIVRGLGEPDNVKAEGSFTQLLKGLQTLHGNELVRKSGGKIAQTLFDEMGVQPNQIEQGIRQAAAQSKLLRDYYGFSATDLKQPVKAFQKGLGTLANKAGVMANKMGVSKNPVLNTSQKLYSASNDSLKELSQSISSIEGGKEISKALNSAIDSGDTISKNAVLFSIIQNPKLRNLVESGFLNNAIK